MAKSQALDAILGTSKLTRAPVPAVSDAPGTARIERPRASEPARNTTPAIVLSVMAVAIAAVFAWNARFELTPTAPIDPVDRGVVALTDIAPIPVEPEDADVVDVGAAEDAGAFGDAATETDAGVTRRASDAGSARGGGTLNVQSFLWAEVSVDGRVIGRTPVVRYRVAAGSHTVRAENPPTGHVEVRTIEVTAGSTTNLRFSLE